MSQIFEQPDMEGSAVKVWLCEETIAEARQNKTAELAIWLAEIRVDDSEVSHKVLALRHLRLAALVDPTLPKHGYELWVLGTNPEKDDQIDPHDVKTFPVMRPQEAREYFDAPDDFAALHVIESLSKKSLDGKLELNTNLHMQWPEFIEEETIKITH